MAVDDFEHEQRRWEAAEAKGRPKSAARLRAREIVEQANWLWRPLIYWDGGGLSRNLPDAGVSRPLAQVIVDRLATQPAGLYLVRIGQAPACDRRKGDQTRQLTVLPVVSEIIS